MADSKKRIEIQTKISSQGREEFADMFRQPLLMSKQIRENLTNIDISGLKTQIDSFNFNTLQTNLKTAIESPAREFGQVLSQSVKEVFDTLPQIDFQERMKGFTLDEATVERIKTYIGTVNELASTFAKMTTSASGRMNKVMETLSNLSVQIIKFGKDFKESIGVGNFENSLDFFGRLTSRLSALLINMNTMMADFKQRMGDLRQSLPTLKSVLNAISISMSKFISNFTEVAGSNRLQLMPAIFESISKSMDSMSNLFIAFSSNFAKAFESVGKDGEKLNAFLDTISKQLNIFGESLSKSGREAAPALSSLGNLIKALAQKKKDFSENVELTISAINRFRGVLSDLKGDAGILQGFANVITSLTGVIKQLSLVSLDDLGDITKIGGIIKTISSAMQEMGKDTDGAMQQAKNSMNAFSQLLLRIGNITKDFAGKVDVALSSLRKIRDVMPLAFDTKSLGAVSKYISHINKLGDAVKKVANLTASDLLKFQQNLAAILPKVMNLKIGIDNLSRAGVIAGASMDRFGRIMRYVFMGGGIYYFVRVLRQFISQTLNEFKQLESNLVSFRAITGSVALVMNDLSDSLNKVAQDFGYMQSEMSQASVMLAKAGLKGQEIADSIYSISSLARAALEDISIATKISTVVMLSYNKTAKDMTSIVNTLTGALLNSKLELKGIETQLNYTAATSAAAGIEFDDLATALAHMSNMGIKYSQVGTSLRGVIGALLSPSSKFAAMLHRLGVSMDDIDVRTHGLIGVMRNLSKAGFDVEKIYASLDRRMAQGLTALVENISQYEEMEIRIKNSASAYEIAIHQMNSFSAAMTRFAATMQSNLFPVIQSIMSLMGSFANILSNVEKHTGLLTVTLKALGVFLAYAAVSHIANWVKQTTMMGNIAKKLTATKLQLAAATKAVNIVTIKEQGINLKNLVVSKALNVVDYIRAKGKSLLFVATNALTKSELVNLKTLKMLVAHVHTSIAADYMKRHSLTLLGVKFRIATYYALGFAKVLAIMVIKILPLIALTYALMKLFDWLVKTGDSAKATGEAYSDLRARIETVTESLQQQSKMLESMGFSLAKYRQSIVDVGTSLSSISKKDAMINIAKSLKDAELGTDEWADKVDKVAREFAILNELGIPDVIKEYNEEIARIQTRSADLPGSTYSLFDAMIQLRKENKELAIIYEDLGKYQEKLNKIIADLDDEKVQSFYETYRMVKEDQALLLDSLKNELEVRKAILRSQAIGLALGDNKVKLNSQDIKILAMTYKYVQDKNQLSYEELVLAGKNRQALIEISKKKEEINNLDKESFEWYKAIASAAFDLLKAKEITMQEYKTLVSIMGEDYINTNNQTKEQLSLLEEMETRITGVREGIRLTSLLFGDISNATNSILSGLDGMSSWVLGFGTSSTSMIKESDQAFNTFISEASNNAKVFYDMSIHYFGDATKSWNHIRDVGVGVFSSLLDHQEEALKRGNMWTKQYERQFKLMKDILSSDFSIYLGNLRRTSIASGEIGDNLLKVAEYVEFSNKEILNSIQSYTTIGRLSDQYAKNLELIEIYLDTQSDINKENVKTILSQNELITRQRSLIQNIENNIKSFNVNVKIGKDRINEMQQNMQNVNKELAKDPGTSARERFEDMKMSAKAASMSIGDMVWEMSKLEQKSIFNPEEIALFEKYADKIVSHYGDMSHEAESVNKVRLKIAEHQADEEARAERRARIERDAAEREAKWLQREIEEQDKMNGLNEQALEIENLKAELVKNMRDKSELEKMSNEEINQYMNDQALQMKDIVDKSEKLEKGMEGVSSSANGYWEITESINDTTKLINEELNNIKVPLDQAKTKTEQEFDILKNIENILANIFETIGNALEPIGQVGEATTGLRERIGEANDEISTFNQVLFSALETSGSIQSSWDGITASIHQATAALSAFAAMKNFAGFSFGGLAAIHKASGGVITGAGSTYNDTSDKIPAWLSNYEYVINSFSTRMFKPLLDLINYKPMVAKKMLTSGDGGVAGKVIDKVIKSPHYAEGGGVDSSRYRNNNNLRPIVINMDNGSYQMYSDEEVANKFLRAMQKRSKTRK